MRQFDAITARHHGFTLIEVLVAFSILSLTLAAVFSLLSTSSRNTHIGEEYSRAAMLAESKLLEIGVSVPLRVGVSHGRFDSSYHWELRVDKVPVRQYSGAEDDNWELMEVVLRVWWESMGQERDITLSTLRLAVQP